MFEFTVLLKNFPVSHPGITNALIWLAAIAISAFAIINIKKDYEGWVERSINRLSKEE
jgi:hypothetical protein